MFLVMQHIKPKAGKMDSITEKLKNREIIKEQPGFMNLSISKGLEEDLIVVLGSWKSEEAWKNWEESEDRKKVEDPSEEEIEQMEVHKLEILQDAKFSK